MLKIVQRYSQQILPNPEMQSTLPLVTLVSEFYLQIYIPCRFIFIVNVILNLGSRIFGPVVFSFARCQLNQTTGLALIARMEFNQQYTSLSRQPCISMCLIHHRGGVLRKPSFETCYNISCRNTLRIFHNLMQVFATGEVVLYHRFIVIRPGDDYIDFHLLHKLFRGNIPTLDHPVDVSTRLHYSSSLFPLKEWYPLKLRTIFVVTEADNKIRHIFWELLPALLSTLSQEVHVAVMEDVHGYVHVDPLLVIWFGVG